MFIISSKNKNAAAARYGSAQHCSIFRVFRNAWNNIAASIQKTDIKG